MESRTKDLLDRIRTGRDREKRKRPLERTLFDRVNGLVRAHALDETFVARLAGPAAEALPEDGDLVRARAKEPFVPPLFSLSGEDEYGLTMAILRAVNNPYLPFAASPEEILLCAPLYRSNPRLGSDALARHHFETLLFAEIAGREIEDLRERLRALLKTRARHGEGSAGLSSLVKRIGRLRRFVASVESAYGSGG